MDHPRISINPKIMSGKPVIAGTRIPVATILAWLGQGETIETLLDEYPGLTREDVLAAQLYAADRLSDDHLVAAE
jgi:uncharacterized protein (DUF433 family)